MLKFLLISTAIFAISFANTIEQKLEMFKTNLNEEEKIFVEKYLPKAERVSNRKYMVLDVQLKKKCEELDKSLREEYKLPSVFAQFNPSKQFNMEQYEKTICDEFLDEDIVARFGKEGEIEGHLSFVVSNLHEKLANIEKLTENGSEMMKIVDDLKWNSIGWLIRHYIKIVEILNEMEKMLKGNNLKVVFGREDLKKQCVTLQKIIEQKQFNLPKDVVLYERFSSFSTQLCNAVSSLKMNPFQSEIGNLKEFHKNFKNYLAEHIKFLSELRANLEQRIAENLDHAYCNIRIVNKEIQKLLKKGRELSFDEDVKGRDQIKYFAELAKIGQEFAENLIEYFNNGQPAEGQKTALKLGKDKLRKKLTSEVNNNGGDRATHYALSGEFEFKEFQQNIFKRIKWYSSVPDILVDEKKIIIKTEVETMQNALQLLDIYQENIGEI